MKRLISSTIFILFSLSGSGQSDTSIVGVWKVISMSADGIYYNLKTDSISLPEELKEKYPDKAAQQKLIAGLKTLLPTTRYHFERGGIFKQSIEGDIAFEGRYRSITSQKIIEITTKNSLNEEGTDKIKYILKNGLLLLSMDLDEETIDLILEKEL